MDLFFSKKATSKDISKVTDVKAVKRSVRNLILTNPYEKPFHPEIAGGIRGLLFELMSPFTAQQIAKKVEDVIHLKTVKVFIKQNIIMFLAINL